MYSAGPKDLPVERTRDRIADLKRHASRVRNDRHPLARAEWFYAMRAANDLECDLAEMAGEL